MSYREAEALKTLHEEIDEAAPRRSRRSDGWIGDAAHRARGSDHNPWVRDRAGVGVVRARDFTHDPAGGLDAGDLADRIVALAKRGHPALGPGAYVIFNRRIASATQDGAPWDWEYYGGDNPHTHHVHVSVSEGPGYDSRAPWGVMRARVRPAISVSRVRELFKAAAAGQPVPASPYVRRIQRRLNRLYDDGLTVDGVVGPRTLNAWGRHERHVGIDGRPRIPDRDTLTALIAGPYRLIK